MKRLFEFIYLIVFVVASAVGCRTNDSKVSTTPPNAGQNASPPAGTAAPPEERKSWLRGWLPTSDQNDPTRERGEYKDGFYEPEYRGISD